MTLENNGFPECIYIYIDRVSIEYYRMGTHDVDVGHGCHPAGEHHYKMLIWPPKKYMYNMGDSLEP